MDRAGFPVLSQCFKRGGGRRRATVGTYRPEGAMVPRPSVLWRPVTSTLRAAEWPLSRGTRSLRRKNLGEFSVFRKVHSEQLRPILGLLDPVKHLRMCF